MGSEIPMSGDPRSISGDERAVSAAGGGSCVWPPSGGGVRPLGGLSVVESPLSGGHIHPVRIRPLGILSFSRSGDNEIVCEGFFCSGALLILYREPVLRCGRICY